MQGPSKSGGPKNDINVTPLVDVVLVLLIIFMVITPMLQKGAEAELPLTKNPINGKAEDDQVTITVQKNDTLYWETEAISEQELASKLSAAFSQNPRPPIFVKGDKGANYGRVRLVMRMVQEAGFVQVGIIVKELEKKGG
jgi:biopolymer transport protein TolR